MATFKALCEELGLGTNASYISIIRAVQKIKIGAEKQRRVAMQLREEAAHQRIALAAFRQLASQPKGDK